MSRAVTFQGKSYTVEQQEHVRFLLTLERRGKKSHSFKQWGKIMPMAEVPTFAAAGRVEDLLPLRLVEIAQSDWGASRSTWDLIFGVALVCEGELQLHFTYSLPASKSWPLERCLMGLGWEQTLQ